MSPMFYGILAIVIFVALLFCGMNIPYAMLFGAAVSMLVYKGPIVAGTAIASDLMGTFSDYAISVAPMFGFMGYLATYTGIGEKLFVCLKKFIGHKPGGLAMAVQVASAGFGAICGTPQSAAATMTAVAYPEMRKAKYSIQLSAMTISSGSTLSVLIPPSSILIIYGAATEQSVGKLFIAGIGPGILMMILNCILIFFLVKVHPDWGPTTIRVNWGERWRGLKNGGIIEVIIVFALAMGGMFAGLFTPTEAGTVGVFGMIIVTLVGRNLNFRKLRLSMLEGVRICAMIYFLLAAAVFFGRVISLSRIPQYLGEFVASHNLSPAAVLALIIFLYFIFGMVADLLAMVLATIPIFYPLIVNYCGYDPAWFGIVIVLMMTVGALTPPMGPGIFIQKLLITRYDPNVPISLLFKASIPWIVLCMIMVLILIFCPIIVTFLPQFVM
ncbi:MAG: TRAP transporter large permease [Clostridiales Family XIII bacterium]|nr:TRAP transporter large permease [Clostridiales Family XIII bacterium]